jgi:hypothetical protein
MDSIFSQKKNSLLSHFSNKLINMGERECPKMSPRLTIGCSCTTVIIHHNFFASFELVMVLTTYSSQNLAFLIWVESQPFTPPAG